MLQIKFDNCPNNIKHQESKIRNKCCQRIEEISKILYQEENFDKIVISLKH